MKTGRWFIFWHDTLHRFYTLQVCYVWSAHALASDGKQRPGLSDFTDEECSHVSMRT